MNTKFLLIEGADVYTYCNHTNDWILSGIIKNTIDGQIIQWYE